MSPPPDPGCCGHEEYVKRQKALLDSGDYSDLIITCGAKTWNFHKATVCPQSGFFARAVKFGKEKAEAKVDLPNDSPKVIQRMLEFIYTAGYKDEATESDSDSEKDFNAAEYVSERVWIHWVHDKFTRKVRCQLAEAIFSVTTPGMQVLVDYVHKTFPDIKPSHSNFLYVRSGRLSDKNVAEILALETGSQSDKRFWKAFGTPTLCYLMYCIGDKYDVRGLQQYVLEDVKKRLGRSSFGFPATSRDIRYIMINTPDTDVGIRSAIAKNINWNIENFGIWEPVEEILRDYPELWEYCVREKAEDKMDVDEK